MHYNNIVFEISQIIRLWCTIQLICSWHSFSYKTFLMLWFHRTYSYLVLSSPFWHRLFLSVGCVCVSIYVSLCMCVYVYICVCMFKSHWHFSFSSKDPHSYLGASVISFMFLNDFFFILRGQPWMYLLTCDTLGCLCWLLVCSAPKACLASSQHNGFSSSILVLIFSGF